MSEKIKQAIKPLSLSLSPSQMSNRHSKMEETTSSVSRIPTMDTIKTKYELLQVLRTISLDEAFTNYKGQPGHILESIGKLAVAFRCPSLPFTASSMTSCRSDDGYVPITNYTRDLLHKNLNTSSEDGASDITFRTDNEETTMLFSSKYFDNDNRALADWEISGLHAISSKHKNPKLGVLTRDKAIFKKRYDSATTKGRCDPDILERVFDIEDLKKALPYILHTCDVCGWDVNEISKYLSNTKLKTLSHPYHQKVALALIRKMDLSNAILLALKCRFGKSYVMAGLIIQQGFKRVMIVTPIPNETTEQLESMFNEYIEFSGYKIVVMDNVAKKVPTGNVIYIVSKQWLDSHRNINLGNLDALFSDENHFAGVTDISKEHMMKYVKPDKTAFFAVTGTGTKSQIGFAIPKSQTISWGFQHDLFCKEGNIEALVEDFGEDARICAIGHDLPNEYSEIPKLVVLGPATQPALIKRICENAENANLTFDINELLDVDEKEESFKHPGKVNGLLIHHFGDGTNPETCIMDRISRMGSRTGQRGSPTIQLFFLPLDNIDARAKCLKKLMDDKKGPSRAHKYLVEVITSETPGLMSKVGFRKHMTNLLEQAANEGKTGGVVVLLGKIGSLGVTIEKGDTVVMLNNSKSFDWYVQALSRALSEDKGANKKYGFLIDYNQQRVLELCRMVGDNHHVKREKGEGIMRGVLKNATKIIDIDPDQMENHERSEWMTDLLFKWWKSSDMNRMEVIAERLRLLASSVKIEPDIITQLRQYMTKFSTKATPIRQTSSMHDDDEKMPEAKKPEKQLSESDKKIEEIPIDPNWAEEIITTIPKFAAILTLKDKSYDLIEMLEQIESDSNKIHVFSTHCSKMWAGSAKDGFITVIKSIFRGCDIHIIREINQSVEMFKEEMQSALIDNPTVALSYVIAEMIPKQHEREENGEVYTPFPIVDMILDKLPQYIWKNPHSTFFDQSVGVGNFMVRIYERLLKGLAQVIPNYESRKRHIIKNQLFMSELNVKNVFVCKTVFGDDCNIHEGDTLLLDIKKKWGIDKFTVIGFNPPYNKNGIRSFKGDKVNQNDEKTETIWTKFIEQAMNHVANDGYLAMIHPPTWLKTSHPLHKPFLNNHIEWLTLWDDSKSKSMIKADIPLGLYVMRHADNISKLNTDVSSVMMRQNISTTSSVYLDPENSIPFAYHSILEKINLAIKNNPLLKLNVCCDCVKSVGEQFPIPKVLEDDSNIAIDTYRIKDGYQVKRMAKPHPHTKSKKLILPNKASFVGSIIDNGKLGLVGNHKFYILGDNLERLQKVFETKIASVVGENTRYGQHFLDRISFDYIPDVRNIPLSEMPEITDVALANYFKFTDEEKSSLGI